MSIIRHRMRAQTAITPPTVTLDGIRAINNGLSNFQGGGEGPLTFPQGNNYEIRCQAKLIREPIGNLISANTGSGNYTDGISLQGATDANPDTIHIGLATDGASFYAIPGGAIGVFTDIDIQLTRGAGTDSTINSVTINGVSLGVSAITVDTTVFTMSRMMNGAPSRNARSEFFYYKVFDLTAAQGWEFLLDEASGSSYSTTPGSISPITFNPGGSEGVDYEWMTLEV